MDRLDENIRLHILQQVAKRAIFEEFENVVVAVVNRERNDLRTRPCLFELFCDIESREARHIDVEKEDVRLQHECAREGFLPVLRLTDHLEIVLKVQHALDPLPEQCVIVRK